MKYAYCEEREKYPLYSWFKPYNYGRAIIDLIKEDRMPPELNAPTRTFTPSAAEARTMTGQFEEKVKSSLEMIALRINACARAGYSETSAGVSATCADEVDARLLKAGYLVSNEPWIGGMHRLVIRW